GAQGRCVTNPVENAPCEVDGGTFTCPGALTCRNKLCLPPATEGTGCDQATDCAQGLTCRGNPPHCQAGLPEGITCSSDAGPIPCADCLTCTNWPALDGGTYACHALAAE